MKAALVAVALLLSPPAAPAGEWWQEDGGRSWGSGGNGAWTESREEAWWLDDGEKTPRDGYATPRNGGGATQPWGLDSTPPEQAPERSRRTYNPWSSDWSDRPWGDIGSRSERERERTERKGSWRRDEGAPRDGARPAYPGYGPAPHYPPGHIPGPATGPWGGMPMLPPIPAPY